MTDHIAETSLGLYAQSPDLTPHREAIEAHLRSCAGCSATLRRIVEFEAALREQESWRSDDASAEGGAASLREFALRTATEDAAARELLAPFEAPEAAARFVWMNIPARAEYRSGGVVRRLCQLANGMCEREPLYALALAEVATAVAAALPEPDFPRNSIHVLRGETWKEQANAFHHLGRFDDALHALERAERHFRALRHFSVGMIAVWYVRAAVLYEQEQLDTAESLCDRAALGALHLGQIERYMSARHLHAEIKFERREYVSAYELFESILRYGEVQQDEVWIARESLTVGICAMELGRLDWASTHLQTARRLFEKLAFRSEVTRTAWAAARLQYLQGQAPQGIHQLFTAVRDLAKLGMVTDAGIAAVDLTEMLLASGRAHEVPQVLAHAVKAFTDAGMLTGALTALAYLKEAAATGTVTPPLLTHVRRFLPRAERQPDLLFAPPPL